MYYNQIMNIACVIMAQVRVFKDAYKGWHNK